MGATQRLLRFGPFELNLDNEELRREGLPLKLSPQPFAILATLAGRSGQVVTREEIQKQVWGEETFVDFEHGLNQCIKQIRTVLNDNPDQPKYVETVPRRGYRFLAPVVAKTIAAPAPQVEVSQSGIQPALAPPSPHAAPQVAVVAAPGEHTGVAAATQLRLPSLAGTTVSHYRVLNIIGGGGMGVVYKAEDLKLPRAVALKFLPEEVRNDPAALAQFEREARAACVLDHPNICSIYEFGEHDGRTFIAMQLLEGCTLRDMLGSADSSTPPAAMPIEQVLNIATQICDGLEAAHEKNILHRDIKPANIFITTKGTAKILDFGLAKQFRAAEAGLPAAAREESGATRSALATGDNLLSAMSSVTGTAAYMSPEQIRGEHLDARTDLFSFGLVLYQMATGQPAFRSETAEGMRELILHHSPPAPRAVNPKISHELAAVTDKCLQRDRDQRFQRAAEIRSELQKIQHAQQESLPRRRKLWAVAAAIIVIAAVGIGLYWHSQNAVALTDKDTLVLADFNNLTGDPVLAGALKQALTSKLEESPFLNVLSNQRVDEALRFMGRTADARLTPEITRQVCERTGSKAMLSGSISQLGNHFLLTLQASNCATGDSIGMEQAEASGREQVLSALNAVSTRMRRRLGESLASVQKYDRPVEQATTPSLEALQAYSLGMAAAGTEAALPFFTRAIELDPKFAMAYARLGSTYANLNQPALASENLAKAYELRGSTVERENLYITAHYYSRVTGELQKARETDLLWRRVYPRDLDPYLQLTNIYSTLGDYQQSLAEAQAAVQLSAAMSPKSSRPSVVGNLAIAHLNLSHFEEAAKLLQQSEQNGVQPEALAPYMYLLAFFRGDKAEMARQLELGAGQPRRQAELLNMQADTEAYLGHLANARHYSDSAIGLATQAEAGEYIAFLRTGRALYEAELGEAQGARQQAARALAGAPDAQYPLLAQIALAMARSGDAGQARVLAKRLNEQLPSDTMLHYYWLPTLEAAIALAEHKPQAALDVLQPATLYELGSPPSAIAYLYPVYLRGVAYLQLGEGDAARAEFQKVLDHNGVAGNFVTAALVRLQLARAQSLLGDNAAASKSYEDFLALWQGADSGLPLYRQAQAEYAKLPKSSS